MPITTFVTAFIEQVGDKWKIVVTLSFILFVMVGFDFTTPAHQFAKIAHTDQALAHADSEINKRIDALEDEQAATRAYLRALAIAQCLDRPRRETLIMGLQCDELMAGHPFKLPLP